MVECVVERKGVQEKEYGEERVATTNRRRAHSAERRTAQELEAPTESSPQVTLLVHQGFVACLCTSGGVAATCSLLSRTRVSCIKQLFLLFQGNLITYFDITYQS